MSVVGLFAGIGGFELAFRRAGFETSMLVEIDEAARCVLRARFPNVRIETDVETLPEIPVGTTIVTAGFPCQNLSMAGDKSGIEGPKSGVVRHMFELIAKARPPVVVIENVNFMLHLDGGMAMEWMVSQFEHLRYSWAYRVLDTQGFGLPQRRRRVYLVASTTLDPRRVLFADDSEAHVVPELTIKRPVGFYWTEGRSGVGFTVDGIPPLKIGSTLGIPSAPAVLFPDGEVLMPSLGACERLQGFDAGWTDVEGTESRDRWRLVGNSVSVPVAEFVANRIKSPGEVKSFKETSLKKGDRWPGAAWNVGAGRVSVTANQTPVATKAISIAKFRDKSWKRLSDRALDGFIARAKEGGLTMPPKFLTALRKAERLVNGSSKPKLAKSAPVRVKRK